MFQKTTQQLELNQKFEKAVIDGNVDEVNKLFEEEPTPYVDHEIITGPAILIAAQKKDWKMVETLYNLNADLDAKLVLTNWSLLHECVKAAPDNVTIAITDYCNVNAQTKKGQTALMVAIREEKWEIANYLIDTGRLDLTLCDEKGQNAAHYVASKGNEEVFLKLIKKGVPMLQKDAQGKTPIDLIEDESFKMTLPQLVKEEKIINVVEEKQETVQAVVEPEKKVSGLSTIKKKPR